MSMNHKNLDILPSLYDYNKEVQILMMNDPRVWILYNDLLGKCHYVVVDSA